MKDELDNEWKVEDLAPLGGELLERMPRRLEMETEGAADGDHEDAP